MPFSGMALPCSALPADGFIHFMGAPSVWTLSDEDGCGWRKQRGVCL